MVIFYDVFFAEPWNVAYHLTEENQIARGTLLTTIPTLEKEWKVSFDFKADSFAGGLKQIFHMTAGGKGAGSGAKYGDRTPAIWTDPKKGFLISSAVGGKYSYSKWFKQALPSAGKWVNIMITQQIEASKMTYSITIGGKKLFTVTNTQPSKFDNVKVYMSSGWYSSLDGSIKNLQIENRNNGKYFYQFAYTWPKNDHRVNHYPLHCRSLGPCVFPGQ